MSVEIYDRFLSFEHLDDIRVGGGTDSIVYRVTSDDSDHVVKVYERSQYMLKPEHIASYYHVTNCAAGYADKTGLKCNFFGKAVPVTINPIANIIFDERIGFFVNISEFVNGVNLSDCIDYDLVPNSPEWFTDEMKQTLTGSRFKWLDMSGMGDVEKLLNRKLGVQGIGISALNVKLIEEGIVLTDLCDAIAHLRIKDEKKLLKWSGKNTKKSFNLKFW